MLCICKVQKSVVTELLSHEPEASSKVKAYHWQAGGEKVIVWVTNKREYVIDKSNNDVVL